MAPMAVYQSSEERTRARWQRWQRTLRQRCRYKRCQLISIQFYRLQSKLLKRTTATNQKELQHTEIDIEIGIEVRAQAWALTMSVPTRYCNLVSWLGLAWPGMAWVGSPRGALH